MQTNDRKWEYLEYLRDSRNVFVFSRKKYYATCIIHTYVTATVTVQNYHTISSIFFIKNSSS